MTVYNISLMGSAEIAEKASGFFMISGRFHEASFGKDLL